MGFLFSLGTADARALRWPIYQRLYGVVRKCLTGAGLAKNVDSNSCCASGKGPCWGNYGVRTHITAGVLALRWPKTQRLNGVVLKCLDGAWLAKLRRWVIEQK